MVATVDVRASLPSASGVPKPVGGEERADAGPRGADPLGEVALRHELELDLAGAVERVEVPGVDCRGKEQMILRTRPGGSARPGRWSPLPALLLTTVRSVAPWRMQRVDQLDRLAGHAEAADHDGGPVVDAGDRGVRRLLATTMPLARTFSRTTARPWPTPMQMAATPQRCPTPRSTGRACPGCACPRRRAGGRWRSRRRAGSRSRGRHPTRRCTPATGRQRPRSARPRRRRTTRCRRASARGWRPRRGVPEVLRLQGVGRAAGDACQRGPPEGGGGGRAADQRRRGAVVEGEALPAVTVPSGRNAGFSPASASRRGVGPDRLVAGEVAPGHGTTWSS